MSLTKPSSANVLNALNAFDNARRCNELAEHDVLEFGSIHLSSQPKNEEGVVQINATNIKVRGSIYTGSEISDLTAQIYSRGDLYIDGSVYSGDSNNDVTLLGRNVTLADSVYGGDDGKNTRLYVIGRNVKVGGSVYSNSIIAGEHVAFDPDIPSKWRNEHMGQGAIEKTPSVYSGAVIISVEKPHIPHDIRDYGAILIGGDEARYVLSLGAEDFRKYIEELLQHQRVNKEATPEKRGILSRLSGYLPQF